MAFLAGNRMVPGRLAPKECQDIIVAPFYPGPELFALPVQDIAKPDGFIPRCSTHLEVFDPGRSHLKLDEFPRRWVDACKVHKSQIASEIVVASDAFVIIQKVTASVKNEPVSVDLNPLDVV